MKAINIRALLTIAALQALNGVAMADKAELNGTAAGDLTTGSLMNAPQMPLANESRDTVTFAWPVDAGQLSATPQAPYIAQSREWRREIDGSELNRGVALIVEGAGAVVRISPLGNGARGFDVADITVRAADGRSFRGTAGMDLLVNAEDMRAAGMSTRDGALGFRFREEIGAGRLVIESAVVDKPTGRYLLSVLDRNSDTLLKLQSAADAWLPDSRMTASASLQNGDADIAIAEADAWLLAPTGERYPAAVRNVAGGTEIDAVLRMPDTPRIGLWELHLVTVAKNGLQRNAKTAFSLTVPTARYDGSVEISHTADTLRVELGTEVSSAGRYEARAVIYGSDAAGNLRPALMASGAAWLEAGRGVLELEVAKAELLAAGVGAPFELRDLRLLDQSRLSLLHRQASALTIGTER